MDKVTIIALIDALIEDSLSSKKENFLGNQGKRGPRGIAGDSFDFESNKDSISNIISNHIDLIKNELSLKFSSLTDSEKSKLKLTFDDLSNSEKDSIRGEKGARGQRGRTGQKGEDLDFEDIKDQVLSYISEIYKNDKSSFKLKFVDLTNEEKNDLSLKFDDLTEEEVLSLTGQKGARGQKGRAGLSGADGQDGLDGTTGKDGLNGLRGRPGVSGLNGRNGKDGYSGKDAAEIIEVEVELVNDEMYFIIYFSDGTKIETNSVALPSITKVISSCVAAYVSSDGGTLKILKDGILLGESEELDFQGDNINVEYDPIAKKSTVTVNEKCISISDEGDQIVSCLNNINFEGDTVEVISGTKMSDWSSLEIVDPIGSWESPDAGNVTVKIETVESVKRLGDSRICSENITAGKIVTAISGESVALGQCMVKEKARILGIALESGSVGDSIQILFFGNDKNVSYSFPLNAGLFLGYDGSFDVSYPVGANFITEVGSSNGTGSIFINIKSPVEVLT